MTPIEILIDDREARSGLPAALRRAGMEARLMRLELADIVIDGRVFIERKSVADFLGSWRDGRLADQLARLAAGGSREWMMMLEGPMESDSTAGADLAALREAILSVQLDWRAPVIRSAGVGETAQWIAAIARRVERGGPVLGSRYDNGGGKSAMPVRAPDRPRPPASPAALQRGMLARVEGVGPKRAAALLEKFGNIHALKAAGEPGWRDIPGIGPTTLVALRKYFGS